MGWRIRKCKAGYRVTDQSGKKNKGTFKTEEAAENRIRQMEALRRGR